MREKFDSKKSSKPRKAGPRSSVERHGTAAPNGIALRALTANVPKHKLIRDAESANNATMVFDPTERLFEKKSGHE